MAGSSSWTTRDLNRQYVFGDFMVPALLVETLGDGRWRQPSEQALDGVVPWRDEPVQLFMTIDEMERETAGLSHETEDDELARIFGVARGHAQAEPIEPHWLDIDREPFPPALVGW